MILSERYTCGSGSERLDLSTLVHEGEAMSLLRFFLVHGREKLTVWLHGLLCLPACCCLALGPWYQYALGCHLFHIAIRHIASSYKLIHCSKSMVPVFTLAPCCNLAAGDIVPLGILVLCPALVVPLYTWVPLVRMCCIILMH